jgi:hypothetical protein
MDAAVVSLSCPDRTECSLVLAFRADGPRNEKLVRPLDDSSSETSVESNRCTAPPILAPDYRSDFRGPLLWPFRRQSCEETQASHDIYRNGGNI